MKVNILEKINDISKVLLEIVSSDGKRRYVVPYAEWLSIKEWYYDNEIKEDYLITLDDSVDSYKVIRISKDTYEINITELSPIGILKRNITNILFSPVPRLIRFFTAFYIIAVLWPLLAVINVIKSTDFSQNALNLGMSLTSLVLIAFLLFNVLFMLFKGVEALIHRYNAFTLKHESFVTDTVLFNAGLLILFVIIGASGLASFAQEIWKSVTNFM